MEQLLELSLLERPKTPELFRKRYGNELAWKELRKTKDAGVISQAIWKRTCLEGIEEIASRQKLLAINPLFTALERYL
jgi:hypothetical protein